MVATARQLREIIAFAPILCKGYRFLSRTESIGSQRPKLQVNEDIDL
jgi:hypothetical protein